MKTIAPEDLAPTEAAAKRYSTGSVVSKDGTVIGYRQLGHGPALVVLHGAMESAQSHMQLAEALADRFTVYLPDRRGRGLSGPYREDHSIETDVQDVAAVLAKTDAHDVMGVSSGAIIWLQATEMEGALERFKAIRADVLLLGGSKSPAYLKAGLDALEKVLPHATRVELVGLGHGATGNPDRGGRPERVAAVLRQFFV